MNCFVWTNETLSWAAISGSDYEWWLWWCETHMAEASKLEVRLAMVGPTVKWESAPALPLDPNAL